MHLLSETRNAIWFMCAIMIFRHLYKIDLIVHRDLENGIKTIMASEIEQHSKCGGLSVILFI